MTSAFRSIAAVTLVVTIAWAATAASGDGGPSPGVDQGGEGVVSRSGKLRYLALPAGPATVVEVIRVRGGLLRSFRIVKGRYGIPFVTNQGETGGLSHNGKLLVLGDAECCGLRTASRFLVLGTKRLRTLRQIALRGDFSYDALAPDGATLYLIQHTSAQDFTRYRVRAYDIRANRLLSRVIVDREEPNEVMRGYPVTRATSADGTWVYTLYAGGKMPFVHALDTTHRQAVCLDLAWKGSHDPLWQMRLRLTADGRKLVLFGPGRTMEVTLPT
jgi:hypothetical protein